MSGSGMNMMAILRRPPSDRKLSERGTVYAFVNYDGGLPSHSKPEAKGRLVITEDRWELRFLGATEYVHAPLAQFPLNVTGTGPNSCRVEICDAENPSVRTAIELPDTSADEIDQRLATTTNGRVGVPPASRGNIYPMTNYGGGLADESVPPGDGSFVLTPNHFAEIWIEGHPTFSKSPITRYPLTLTSTGPTSCTVTIHDLKEPLVEATFDLPHTPLEALQADLSSRPNGTWSQEAEDLQRKKVASKQSATFTTTYLGGLPEDPRKHQVAQNLHFSGGEGIGYGLLSLKKPLMTWKQVTSISVEGSQVAKNKIGAELAFGIFGALGAKGAKDRTYIIINRSDGAQGIWEVDKVAPMQVRADLSPVMKVAGVPFADDAPASPVAQTIPPVAQSSMAEEIERLAGLRERGILTDEEFKTAKARLLES